MQGYHEQTVSADMGGGKKIIYLLSLLLSSLLILAAMVSAAFVLGETESGGLKINWLAIVVFVLFIAAAIVLWRFKDYQQLEYDYIMQDDSFTVVAVLNRRRRIRRLKIDLGRISSCGTGTPSTGAVIKLANYCLHPGIQQTYICYEENGERKCALLELNEDMIAALRRDVRPGIWRDSEGKTSNYAGLS